MDNPRAEVLAVRDGYAVVSVSGGTSCARCAAGKGCGAGLIQGSVRSREIEVPVASGMRLAAGDKVSLGLPAADLLRAALFAYGLPLAGTVVGLAVARLLQGPLTDPVAVIVAAAGLSAGWLGSRLSIRRTPCVLELRPVIVDCRIDRRNAAT